jgi:hypothetical protein
MKHSNFDNVQYTLLPLYTHKSSRARTGGGPHQKRKHGKAVRICRFSNESLGRSALNHWVSSPNAIRAFISSLSVSIRPGIKKIGLISGKALKEKSRH